MPDVTRALIVQDGIAVEDGSGFYSGAIAPDFDAPLGSRYSCIDGRQYTKVTAGVGSTTWFPADAVVPIFLSANGTSHPHTCYITWKEMNDLMMGTVASVVRDSSVFGTHIHTVTITWDSVNRTLKGSSTTNAFHNHGDIVVAPQSTYGSEYQTASSLTESTTTNTAFQTKLTLTTTSLPLGNYVVHYSFGLSNSGGKEMQAEFRNNGTRVRLIYFQNGFSASAGQYTSQGGFNNYTNISGIQTFDIRYSAPNGNTTRIGDATITIFRTL